MAQLQLTQLSLLESSPVIPSPNRIAGVDEVGRGCLFGPVIAAAVILSPESEPQLMALGVTDSKKLTAQRRAVLAREIRSVAVSCKIGIASVQEIDRLNILAASLLAMRRAIARLDPQPELCLIDGNQVVPSLTLPQQTLIQGDSRCLAIAAASIIAKVWRDDLMIRLAKRYPQYDLATNKGYGTAKHRVALEHYGPTRQHRLSFAPCASSLRANEQAQAESRLQQECLS